MLEFLQYNHVSFSSDGGFAPGLTFFATSPRAKITGLMEVLFLISESQFILDNDRIVATGKYDVGDILFDFNAICKRSFTFWLVCNLGLRGYADVFAK